MYTPQKLCCTIVTLWHKGGYNKAEKEGGCQFVLCHSTFHTGISHHRLLPNVVLKAMKGTPTHNAHMPMGRNTNTIP